MKFKVQNQLNIKFQNDLRSLTPPTTRVVGSSRFKFPSDFGFFAAPSSEFTTRLGFRPILEASNTSNPAAGRKIRSVQYLNSARITRRTNSSLIRWPGFLRFRRTRTRIRPSSSSSSSETEIDMLLLLNIDRGSVVAGIPGDRRERE